MDDFSIKDGRIDSALNELKIINRYLGGVSVTEEGLAEFYRGKHSGPAFKILDAGSGSSDILFKIKKRFKEIRIYPLDKNLGVCYYLKKNNSPDIICGDIFALPYKEEYFSIAHASLFLHHFSPEELKIILENLLLVVKKGIIINELRRNIFAFIGIKILTFFSRSELVKNDAPLSVKKGFIKKELEEIFKDIPAAGFTIKRKWAFRWLVVVLK